MTRFLLTLTLFGVFLTSCNKKNDSYSSVNTSTFISKYRDGYVGDENCKSCHETAYEDWRGSHHDLAMQEANATTVLGDFNNQSVSLDGVDYRLYKNGEEFMVDVKEIDSSEKTYIIKYTFGITPLQQYMIDFDKGKKQVLRLTWDTIEKKWFHQYANDQIRPNDWLHWSKGGQNWNTMCAECHSTNLQKNYDVAKDSFATSYSMINVNCESCHGPGEKHLLWAEKKDSTLSMYTFTGLNQAEQIKQCGPCHSRRVKLTENFTPGLDYDEQFMLQTITPEYYFADGQINEEDYVLGSFMQSKMYMNGIKCSDCHNPHSMELKFEGNKLCLQCHVPDKYDSKNHHFHEMNTEASLCINCHMTGRYYMGNDFRRDHSFRNPRPDQSEEFGTPNACTACHKDKSNSWASNYIVQWYGPERLDHFSDYLVLSTKENISASEKERVHRFILNVKYPSLTRATALENLSMTSEADLKNVLEATRDSASLIRFKAAQKLMNLPLEDRAGVGLEMMKDPSKLVRLGAAQLLLGFNANQLNESDRAQVHQLIKEYEKFLYANADFAAGNLNLGDYFMQINDPANAIRSYQNALKKDSLLFPAYTNLATALNQTGKNEEALKMLNTLIQYYPNNGRPYYLRALLHFELQNNEQAINDLKTAIDLDDQDSRARYNLATYYFQNFDYPNAEKYVRQALLIEPENRDYTYLLALIYRDSGRARKSQELMQKLNQSNI
ncbi:tetratricopeptide repeat protein [Namhaeicola litoreus]|uniref:Tetratricopeptide repeat protein n=1 Tax=Namhaeicola litoreus TaxID=1052145 RepID=A0ABW3Y401_9FLAO